MSANLKRGFNRIFIVLTVLWAGYCLFAFPIQMQRNAFEFYKAMERPCSDIPYNPYYDSQHTSQTRKDCHDFAAKMWRDEASPWEWSNYYQTNWAYILVALVLVPLAVYGICRAAGLIVVWVVRGFRTTTPGRRRY